MLTLVLAFSPASLQALAQGRSDFEARLHEPYNHHVACMMMGAGNTAYFPAGVATRRYLLQVIQDQPHRLYQCLRGARARTEWTVILEDRKGSGPKIGTLGRVLWNEGYTIARHWLTRSVRKALNAEKSFAFYSAYGPDSWIEA